MPDPDHWPGSRPQPAGRSMRWTAVVLSGPLLVYPLIKVDWGFFGRPRGPLDLTGELIVEELVVSFKLTLAAIVSLLVFRALLPQNRWSKSVAALLPVTLWGLEATQLQRTVFFSGGSWAPHFLLFQLWLVPIVAVTTLGFVLLSGILHSCDRQPGHRPRRIVRAGAGTVLAATVVVATVLLDWLLFSLVIGESVAEKIP